MSVRGGFRAALYIRLSREDGDSGESDSVANQRDLLKAYTASDPSILSFREFVDDGFTGTSFDRPAFNEMLAALRSGSLNCVIVKDLSRFGRNYIGTGRFLEEEFPALGVRFIALGDNIDTYLRPEQSESILLPFKNLINDEYSRDISKKIRAALDTRRRQGRFIGSRPAYGYRRDPDNPGHLVPDPEAAAVVREIFDKFLSGVPKNTIARELNARKIPPPSARFSQKRSLWGWSSIDNILKNPVYTGDMVQGRWGNVSYKVQKSRRRPEERWFSVSATHEPLVSREDFAKTSQLLRVSTHTDGTGTVRPLAGLVRCADCGRALGRRRVRHPYGVYEYYVCPTWKQDKTACTSHSVRVDRVEEAVLSALREELQAAVDFKKLQKEAEGLPRRVNRSAGIKQALDRVMELKRGLYGDWRSGELSREEYLSFKESYDREETELRQKLSDNEKPFDPLSVVKGLELPDKLERGLCLALIKEILVSSDAALTISFNFSRPES